MDAPDAAIDLPLQGIRVLDLTRLLPGPAAGMHLADMGAEVIKIEEHGIGDYARAMGPMHNGTSLFFQAINRGKQFLRLDLKNAIEREHFLSMLENADVVMESFRPGVMDKLGLSWDVLKQHNPRLVLCSISGYGQSGPLARMAGHDINYVGYAGMLEQNTGPDGVPALPNLQIGDLLGGTQSAVQGILAALIGVKMNGRGRHVDVAMTDCVLAHNIMPLAAVNHLGKPAAPGSDILTGGVPCYNVYRTRDARFMAVGALEFKFWEACCQVLGRPDLIYRHWSKGKGAGSDDAKAVKVELDQIFATEDLAYWTAKFSIADCCVSPVLRMDEALQHPHFIGRQLPSRTPAGDGRTLWKIAPAIKFFA